VEAAAQGRVLHPLVLGAVATTLGAAARLLRTLGSAEQQGAGYPALRELAAGLGDALPQLQRAIEQCVQVRGGWGALPPPCRVPLRCPGQRLAPRAPRGPRSA
jgi:hypothetical protein